MKKKKIIYAVHGMMEYTTIVKAGKNSVKVSFTGGSISNGCAQPARYTTSNLIMQDAIERCDDYVRGRIKRERIITLNEDLIIETNQATAEPATVTELIKSCVPNPEAPAEAKNPEIPCNDPGEGEACQTGEQSEEIPENENPDTPADNPTAEASVGHEIVDASCKDVAKQYLQEHYGENPVPLRTREDIQKCAAKHGIQFNFV